MWQVYCSCWHHNYIMLMSSLACLLCMLTSQLCHADVIHIWVSHVGRVNWYSGRVSSSGRRRRVGCVGRRPAGEWWRVRPCTTSDFDAVFTSGFVSASSTQWCGQNTIVRTFIFEQKSNTPLNHVLWYQLLGIPAPPCADRGCSDSCP